MNLIKTRVISRISGCSFNSVLKLLVLLQCILSIVVTSKTMAAGKIYSLGVVPQFETRKIQEIWKPILQMLEVEHGISLRLDSSPSIPEFEQGFVNGDFDFAYMNPYHLIVANKEQGYLPIVMDHRRKLYGIIVVRKDSEIRSLEQLNDKTIAFPAPNALGAALVPRAEFKQKYKISFVPKYVKSHTSVYLNVLLRKADAGGGVQKTLAQQKDLIKESLRVLYETEKFNPHPIAVHPRVPREEWLAVQDALLSIDKNAKGKLLLGRVPIDSIGKAEMKDYESIKAMGLEGFYVKGGAK